MRDIRADLKNRADGLKQQIDAAQKQLAEHCQELEREHSHRLAELKAQLDAVERLIAVATWHQNIRSATAAALKAATIAADVTQAACRSSARQTAPTGGQPCEQKSGKKDSEKP